MQEGLTLGSDDAVLPPALERVRRYPGMYLSLVDFDGIVSFLTGYDCADSGALLGFREWLVVSMGEGDNFVWHRLLAMQMERLGVATSGAVAVEFVMAVLERFWRVKSRQDGVRQIYREYEEWVRRQS
jgi:hypothetical protein